MHLIAKKRLDENTALSYKSAHLSPKAIPAAKAGITRDFAPECDGGGIREEPCAEILLLVGIPPPHTCLNDKPSSPSCGQIAWGTVSSIPYLRSFL
jgi:hypothetical protein